MALKDFLNKLVKSQGDHNEANTTYESLLSKLYHEAKKDTTYFYGQIKLSQYPTYQQIKNESNDFKINLILFLPKVIYDESRKVHRPVDWSNKQYQDRNNLNLVRQSVLSALLRTKLTFEDQQLIQLMDEFRQFTKGNIYFSQWPIGFYVTQLSKHIASHGLSDDLRSYLMELIESDKFSNKKNYWGADLQKAKIKIEEAIFQQSDSEMVSPPYRLNEGDEFGTYVNEEIGKLLPEEAQYWHQLFFHTLSATAGKPTKKFLKTSKEIVAEIGNQKFKTLTNSFFDFVIKLKEQETQHTQSYRGQTYTYSTWIFLEEKNSIILKGLVWSMVQFHDSTSLATLANLAERSFKKIPGVGPAAASVGNATLYVLANSRGLEGISHLSRLKLKIKQNNTKKLIQKYLEEGSQKLGISPEEIEELSIPDFGLVNGFKKYSFDDYKLSIEIIGVGRTKMTWTKPDGSYQKSVPAFVKQSKKLSQLLSKAKDENKKIQKYSSAQRDRIDRLFILDREWTYEQFSKFYFNHGLIAPIASKLIWYFEIDNQKIAGIYSNEQWHDLDENSIPLTSETKVSLWHPIFDTTENTLGWRNRLEQLQWQQPIKQAYREIYILTDAEINTRLYSNRMAAHLLKQHQFSSLASIRNWKYQLMGAYDDGRDTEVARLALPAWGLTAEYWINELYMEDSFNEAGIWNYVATDQIRFVDNNNNTLNLIDVPKIVLSEVLRDADLFVGVASIGNDPTWQDSGTERTHQMNQYWSSYSFGDLNEMAKTRKQVLERLIPRLKIKSVAEIDGKFLRVKGKIRTYKIHIGSSNILMEPNDQYLCIVPSGKAADKTSGVFLPFEGDRGLSVVLSKAFLLADDDKITDTTILTQINR